MPKNKGKQQQQKEKKSIRMDRQPFGQIDGKT